MGMNILAVDDDPLQLVVLSATLASAGLPPLRTATSAAAALEEISTAMVPFDLFLLDIQMPETDGIALCQQIRALRDYREVPVIMLTAVKERGYMERAFAAGAHDYVTKPFDKLELVTRIRIAHRVASARREAEQERTALDTFREEVCDANGMTPDAPVTILGVPNVVDYIVLSNFMLEMPFLQTFSATAFAVQITGFTTIYHAIGKSGAYDLLTNVARALSLPLTGRGFFVAYAGSGIFVCAAQGGGELSLEDLVQEVETEISEGAVVGAAGRRYPLALAWGRQQTNGLFTLDRRTGLLLRAIDDVNRAPGGTGTGPRFASSRRKAPTLLRRLTGLKYA